MPGHKVSFVDQLIRVYGETAINTGYYTFSYVKDGETKTIPARYRFVYVKGDKGWLIVDHHSSAVPAPCAEGRFSRLAGPRPGASSSGSQSALAVGAAA